ncbi:hypothetical protein ACV3RL_09880 [Clostridium perfringens]
MDKYISDILNENKKIKKLYEEVEKKLKKQGKKINIYFFDSKLKGETEENILLVDIFLSKEIRKDRAELIAIFIHELGEADYIANKLPKVFYKHDSEKEEFTELLSHSHINKIVKKYDLTEEMSPISRPNSILKKRKYKIENFINLIYRKITYNLDDKYMIENIDFYSDYKECVNEVVKDIESLNTVDIKEVDVLSIEKKCEQIVEKINEANNYDDFFIKSNLSNTVLFKDTKSEFEINIDKEICKKIIDNKDNFENINILTKQKEIEINGMFDDNTKVKDTYRYKISFEENYPKFIDIVPRKNEEDFMVNSNYKEYPISHEKEIKSIVIILESPHKDEYLEKDKHLIPKGPAQGKTGEGIKENILVLLNELQQNYDLDFKNGIYRVILINSIMYQTSIYSLHKVGLSENLKYQKLRDNIWRQIWANKESKKLLNDRVKKSNPYLIINACTKVGKEEISKLLSEENYENIIETNHPCTWKGFGIKKLK